MQKFAVIGLGRFGEQLARALTASGAEVIAVDRDPALVERIRDEVTLAVCLDCTDEEALRAQGIDEIETVIVGIGVDFESAALAVAILRKMGVPRVIARAETEIQGRILKSIGASEVASPEREAALRWAHRLSLPNIQEYVALGESHSIVYVEAPSPFQNKTLAELRLRNEYQVNLVAISRKTETGTGTEETPRVQAQVVLPRAETTIQKGDVLILVGSDEAIGNLPQS